MNKNIKYLIEDIVNFNPIDYSDEDPDLIDDQIVTNIIYKYFPKDKKELQQIIIEKLKENIQQPYLNDIDTSRITDMSELFSNFDQHYLYINDISSSEIIKLDLSAWDTSNVTDMSYMFRGCGMLKTLDLSNQDMSNVTDMSYMFFGCESLEKLDLSNQDTSSVTNMQCMFYLCSSLMEFDLSGWDTSNVESMSYMFCNCKSLEELDISNWDISSVTDIWSMFSGCKLLKELDLSGWDTSNITDMSRMFNGCSSLQVLDLSGWDVSNVTNMLAMFYHCKSLEELNISGWNISKVTNMDSMFDGCKRIIIPDWYKKRLIENKLNFNPVDYSDEEPDLIDNQSVSSLTYKYKYFPKNKKELQQTIIEKLKENIEEPYLNDIDTSEIKNMSNLFSGSVENYLYGKKNRIKQN